MSTKTAGRDRLHRVRYAERQGKEHEEIAYGFTNLPRKKAGAKRLLDLNQKHWSIENRFHYRRDVTLGEGACQVRIKGAPQVLAALNGGVLATSGLVGREQCGFTDAAFLCPASRSSPLVAWQAFTVIRVLRKALS